MDETAVYLKEKYGLYEYPDEIAVKRWITKTKRYLLTGMDPEKAGKASAAALFPSYGSLYNHNIDSNQNVIEIINSLDNY